LIGIRLAITGYVPPLSAWPLQIFSLLGWGDVVVTDRGLADLVLCVVCSWDRISAVGEVGRRTGKKL